MTKMIKSKIGYLERITDANIKENQKYIEGFHSKRFKNAEINLKKYIYDPSIRKKSTLYLVKNNNNNNIIAYFALSTASVFYLPTPYGGNLVRNPAVCIDYFCLNDKYAVDENGHGKGLGKYIFQKFTLPLLAEIREMIGFTKVILFAIKPTGNEEKIIQSYIDWGFVYINDPDTAEYIQSHDVKGCCLMVYNYDL